MNYKNIDDVISEASRNNFALEFSSGLPYDGSMLEKYNNCSVKRMPHNYFPAPLEPFVLNLASSNDAIRSRSIEHCINGLRIAKSSSSPFFSAHIGFCIDPCPHELGRELKFENAVNKVKHRELFVNSIKVILEEAIKLDIGFLIENNVITKFNIKNGINPLLGCTSDEIISILHEINSPNLGLLLDTAHLKVSCATLNLDLKSEVFNLENYIKCIHHSDNEGLIDNNLKLKQDYWFLPFMNKFDKIPHVIEVRQIDTHSIFSQINILKSYEL